MTELLGYFGRMTGLFQRKITGWKSIQISEVMF